MTRTLWIAGVCTLAGALVGCEPEAPRPAPTPKAPEAAAKTPTAAAPTAEAKPKVAADPGVQDDGSIVSAVTWFHGSVEQAKAKAKAEGKLLFVDVGAYWCPPCQKLDEQVFVLPKVAAALEARYVPVHVDAEKGEGPEFVEEHHIQAYPTMLVLEPSGMEKGRVVDFLEADALLTALERIEAGQSVLADVVAQVDAKPDDIALRQRLGHLHVLAGDREAAEAQFVQVLEADPTNEMGLASKVLYDRALFIKHKLDADHEGAVADFRALQEQFPDSKEAVRAYRHIGRILNKLGKPDEAIASLDAMLQTDPEDIGLASSFGWFSFRQKCKPARGLEVVSAALVREPKNADLLYLKAELAHLTGDEASALAAIQAARDVEPNSAFFRRQVRRFEGGA
ncbi:MAG: tetratricopeptide repeat protein [Myxococcota bacterium]